MKSEIILGDCLEVMKTFPDKSFDMILCDLPYGTTSCSWDTVIPFKPLWAQYERIIKDNGAIGRVLAPCAVDETVDDPVAVGQDVLRRDFRVGRVECFL